MADYNERMTYISEMAEAEGYSQDYVDLLKDCAEWAERWQWVEVRKGLEAGVDVSVYADPKYVWQQMREILDGLELDVDVSKYADPKFGPLQMGQILEGLLNNVDVSKYADPKYDWEQMRKIRERLEAEKN